MTSISNVNNQMSYFSELPQELKSVIYSKLCDFAKSGDKEALKALIQSAYVSKQFFHDPEVKKERNLCLLDIKMRKECSDDIYKVYLYSLNKLGFLPMIGNPSVKEIQLPIAFVQNKLSGEKGFILKVHGRKETTAEVHDDWLCLRKTPVKDISDHIFVCQRRRGFGPPYYYDWKISNISGGALLIFRIYKSEPDDWMPIILNIIEGKDPYFELDSSK